jgi:inorganic pyrophosphatase
LLNLLSKLTRLFALAVLVTPVGSVHALDGQTQDAKVSMHDVAQKIRQSNTWQILDAKPKEKKSGYKFFQFKVINKKGQVKVINIDPNNPNLRKLEQ